MTGRPGGFRILARLVGPGASDVVDPLTVDPAGPERGYLPSGGGHGLLASPDGERHTVLVLDPATSSPGGLARPGSRRVEVVVEGWRFEVDLEPADRAVLRARASRSRGGAGQSGPVEVRAIIPGVVVSVAVAAGDHVVAGQQLLAVDAMKMQNELRAPRDGTIAQVVAAPGRTIEVGDLLVVIA